MRNVTIVFLMALIMLSCQREEEYSSINYVKWEAHKADISDTENLFNGKSYLPVYSHIYHLYEHRTFDLTVTVSIRNISAKDSVYILKADYFNTEGNKIRQYLKHPVFLKPMETIEIIIEEEDTEGGSGANFVFEWAVENEKNPPLFEAVMISTYGQQGLSFTTRAVDIFD